MNQMELIRIYRRRTHRKLRGKFGTEKRLAGFRALLRYNDLVCQLIATI